MGIQVTPLTLSPSSLFSLSSLSLCLSLFLFLFISLFLFPLALPCVGFIICQNHSIFMAYSDNWLLETHIRLRVYELRTTIKTMESHLIPDGSSKFPHQYLTSSARPSFTSVTWSLVQDTHGISTPKEGEGRDMGKKAV